MRILLTLGSLQMGGAERNVVGLLPKLRAIGVDAVLCTLGTRPDSSLGDVVSRQGVERVGIGARRLLDPLAFRRFVRVVREMKISVVHSEDQDATLFCAAAAPFVSAKWIYTRHIEVEELHNFRARVRARLTLAAARRADGCVAVSEAIKEDLHRRADVPLQRISTIYNGIDVTRFRQSMERDRAREMLGWSADEVVVLLVAVIRLNKGHDILLRAVPQLREKIPGLKIKFVGDGPYRMKRQQEAAHLSDCVEFLGQRDDLPLLLRAADLLVQPSLTEGLPTAPIEAGAASVPVVATDVGGTREIIEDNQTGLLVPPGDPERLVRAMFDILLDSCRAAEMGRKAQRRIVDIFTFERQARETASLYSQVAGVA